MDYKLYYIEDINTESRKSDLEDLGFRVKQYDPDKDINKVIEDIIGYSPNVIVMDYRLNEGQHSVYYDAPTIAATLRSNKHKDGTYFPNEIPIILISNEDRIDTIP